MICNLIFIKICFIYSQGVCKMSWPVQGLDFNPIENLCDVTDRKIHTKHC